MAKRLTAKQIVQDIKAGLTDEELITKYNLSGQLLPRLFDKLISINAITKEDLDARTKGPQSMKAPLDAVEPRQFAPTELLEPDVSSASGLERGPEPLQSPLKPKSHFRPPRPAQQPVTPTPATTPPSPEAPRPEGAPAGGMPEAYSPFAAIRYDVIKLARKYRFSSEDILWLKDRYGLGPEIVQELLRSPGQQARDAMGQPVIAPGEPEVQERPPAKEMAGPPSERPYAETQELAALPADEESDEIEVEFVTDDEEGEHPAAEAPEPAVARPGPKPDEKPKKIGETRFAEIQDVPYPSQRRPRPGFFSVIWFLVKFVIFLLIVGVFAASVLAIRNGIQVGLIPEFQQLKPVNPVPEARRLVKEGRYCDATEYLKYFREYPEVRRERGAASFYNRAQQITRSWWSKAQGSIEPFWRDKGPCLGAIVNAPAAGFYTSAKLSDLAWQGTEVRMLAKPDKFSAALAGLGKLLSGPERIGSVQAEQLKGTVSLLVVAKRLNKISGSLEKELTEAFKLASMDKSLKPLVPVIQPISRISRMSSLKTRDVIAAVAQCNKISDLRGMETVASVYRAKTGKVLVLGGHAAGTAVSKYARDARLPDAMEAAILYGGAGTALLERVGPKSFMNQIALANQLARIARVTGLEQPLTKVLPHMKSLPPWSLLALAFVTGIIVLVGVLRPIFRALSRMQKRRLKAA
jgi:hypothetical protein